MGLESLDSEGKKEEEVTVTVNSTKNTLMSDTKGQFHTISGCAYVHVWALRGKLQRALARRKEGECTFKKSLPSTIVPNPMIRCVLLIVAAAACVAAAPVHSTALFHPSSASMNAACPHTYTVLFHTTKGDFEVQVEQAWAPIGAQRFYNLVQNGEQRNQFGACAC